MEEAIFSPASQRISELKKLRDEKASGIYSGIPLWESFPMLTTIVPTIDKGQCILNFASSGVGKSMITRYKDILAPWLYVRRHPELGIDLKFVIFLLEDDINRFKDYMLSCMLYMKYGIALSPKQLKSSFEVPISDDIFKKMESLVKPLDDLLSICVIEDSTANTYGIYKKCRLLSEQWGVHYYTDMIDGSHVVTKAEYNVLKSLPDELKDLSLDELKLRHDLSPVEYKNFYKYSHYTPNNPKQHIIGIIDNINCLEPDKKELTLKAAMENMAYGYIRKNMAKHWNWTWVMVQQSMGTAEEQQFDYKGGNVIDKLIPNLSHLGDSKLTQRACHLIYGLWDPSRYGINSFMDYNLDRLKDYSRFLFLLKNNDGVANKVIPLYFNGASSYFKELEPPNKITEKYYKELNL